MFLEKVAKLVLAGFGSGISEEQLSSRLSFDSFDSIAQQCQFTANTGTHRFNAKR